MKTVIVRAYLIFSVVIATFLFTGNSFAQPRGPGMMGMGGPCMSGKAGGMGYGMMLRLSSQLTLTAAQQEKITSLQTEMRQDWQNRKANRQGDSRAEMANLFRAESLDQQKLAALIEKRHRQRMELKKSRPAKMVKIMAELHLILTPGQRGQLANMYTNPPRGNRPMRGCGQRGPGRWQRP